MSADPAARSLPEPRRSTMPTPADLVARRAAAGPAPRPEVPGVEVRDARYGDVPCVVCDPPRPRGVLAYFHGGGYRLGSAAGFAPFAARLAAATGSRVVAVDYRLAPEHPFPAALHDAMSVHERILAESGRPPAAVGDSAGGGLAAALVVACARTGTAAPRALVLASAWLDLRCGADSYTSRAASDRLFSHAAARQAAEQYLQGHDPGDPLASPLLSDPAAFPPTLLLASADEVLLDDTLAMASALAGARVPTVTRVERDVPHAWPAIAPDRTESAAALETIARFIEQEGT
ncbi:alpha/beta hydrolase fold domain-containing protein [Actinomadura sp. LOL_016]|uniref:alpha/beta hydrolase fold domain-containing protein n=1 Tax=unclassified Actinomadura TaxID=2626254 RepID=UPI003A8077A7